MQRILTYVSLLGVYPLLIASSVIVLANVVWGYQALVEAFECFIFYITFIVLHSLECKYDPKPCSDQDYLKIGMKKYKDDITFSGVPLNYNDAVDNEEDRDVKLRQQVLSKIIASVQMHQQNSLFSNERLNSCRLQKTMRRAFSYKHLPVIEEESDESDNEENKQDGFFYYKPKRKRRFSIGTDSDLEKYADETFFKAIDDIRSGKYLPNNVYADSHPEREYTEDDRMFHQERATQTDDNDLKLLWRLARTIPAFKLTDILGEFEVDPNGMYIIVRDGGLLKDKHGRLVNSRGYLVDIEGNVIHHNGKLEICLIKYRNKNFSLR